MHPVARGPAGLVAIDQWHDGLEVACVGCDRPMVAKRGSQIRWHYAHAADHEDARCSAETVLHRTAKELVREGFAEAQRSDRPYVLHWPCPYCGVQRSADVRAAWSSVEVERSLAPNTRADVACLGRRPSAIEVVVTHAPESATLDAYRAAGVPVFVVRPTWETVSDLRREVRASEAHHVAASACPACRRVEHLRVQLRERERTWEEAERLARSQPRSGQKQAQWITTLLAAGFDAETAAHPYPSVYRLKVPGVLTVLAVRRLDNPPDYMYDLRALWHCDRELVAAYRRAFDAEWANDKLKPLMFGLWEDDQDAYDHR